MDVLVYLLVIIGSPWLSDAMIEFRGSQVGRLVPYVEQPAKNVKAGPPCYCVRRTCYFCPGNTYCTVDKAGCCPRPGCRNHCHGRWCLCPGYPICCPDGACPKNYPKCCGKVCCKNDGNCCEGKHCCDAKSSCCGNGCCPKDNGQCCTSASTKEKLCCVKQRKDLNLEEEDRREVKEDVLDLNNDDGSIFKDLCKTFKATGQYAILLVGRHELDPKPKPSPYDSKGLCIGNNYAAARFLKGGKHTEDIILTYADDMVNKYKGKYGENPELFLFSKNSPCCGSPLSPNCDAGCAGKIKAKLTELSGKITSMIIAWDNNYKLGPMPFDKAFLFSLNSMLSPGNAQLSWNTNGFCRNTPRKWFQKTMFECLLHTAKGHPFCTSASVEQDLARLINKVTWICGTSSTTETNEDEYYPDQFVYDGYEAETLETKTVGASPARAPECWKNKVKSLDSFLCSQLPEKAYECANEYKSNDLGPALNPSNPTTFSNSASDVRGEYGKVCFESGSCTTPKGSQAKRYEEKNDQTEKTGFKDDL